MLRQHIHLTAEDALEPVPQLYECKGIHFGLHPHDEVDVAAFTLIPTRHRAEQTNTLRPEAHGGPEDRIAVVVDELALGHAPFVTRHAAFANSPLTA